MRICFFIDSDGHRGFGKDLGDGTVAALIGDPLDGEVELTDEVVAVAHRLPPVFPPDVWCIGKNYAQHAREFGGETPTQPVVFMKPSTAVLAAGQPVVLPACQLAGPEVDYEAELAVVIGYGPDGQVAKDVAAEHALEYVLGYTAGNDISARHWQKQLGGGQWVRGKSFDTFCPLGPVLVTAKPLIEGDEDFIDDPQALAISTTINGEELQRDTTANMVFPVAELIAFISQDTTLLPGTVILTGTPAGVGMARNPPRFLQPGDDVVVEIERIGTLRNPVVAAGEAGEV